MNDSHAANMTTGSTIALNEKQRAVLAWIVQECPPGLYLDDDYSHRITARALKNRGLIELSGHGLSWRAVPTERGRRWPEASEEDARERARVAARTTPDTSPNTEAGPSRVLKRPSAVTPRVQTRTVAGVDAGSASLSASGTEGGLSTTTTAPKKPKKPGKHETIPMVVQIRKPHPAIRELVDHKTRLDVPADARQRALLILHALVREALQRGWTVTPVLSEVIRDSWTGSKHRRWPSAELFHIDAGHHATPIRLRMRQRRIDHVLTKKEIDEQEQWGRSYFPRYDYVPTDYMRLEVDAGSYGSLVIEDTVATRIEDKLLRAIERIKRLTQEALEWEERARLRAIEEAEARRRAEEVAARGRAYGTWVDELEALREAYSRHRELNALLIELRAAVPRFERSEHVDQLQKYVTWATRHVEQSDPLRSIPLPDGDIPEMPYDEWRDWQARSPQRLVPGSF